MCQTSVERARKDNPTLIAPIESRRFFSNSQRHDYVQISTHRNASPRTLRAKRPLRLHHVRSLSSSRKLLASELEGLVLILHIRRLIHVHPTYPGTNLSLEPPLEVRLSDPVSPLEQAFQPFTPLSTKALTVDICRCNEY